MSRPSIESLFDATIVLDDSGNVHRFSASAEQTFGRSADDVLGRPLTDLVPRFHADAFRERGRTLARHADGAPFPVEVVAWPEGEQTVLLLRDLRDQDLQAGVDGGGRWEVNPVTREATWSPRTYALHGVEPRSFVPTPESFLPLIEPEDRPKVLAGVEAILGGGLAAPIEYRLAQPPGGVRILRATTLDDRSPDGTVNGVCHDVTAQRLTRARLEAHEAIAHALASWESGTQDVRALLQHLFLVMGWKIAVIWVPADDILVCRAFVAETGMEVGVFEQEVRDLKPRKDSHTLCGEAWAADATRAVADIGQSGVTRAEVARDEGIRGAMAIPALHGGETLAVFEFFSPERRDLEPEMLDTLNAIGRQLGSFLARRRSLLAPPLLTPRELEMLQYAADGESIPEIAARLVISPATVKTHFQNVYGKLGVNDRPAAVAVALRTGLIT